jgi:tetratricopeptide (TPR) repeat protein
VLTVAFCVLCFWAAGRPFQAGSEPSSYYQIEAAFKAGKLKEAESMLRVQLETHPRDPQLLDWLGTTLDAEHKYSEAEQYYLQALTLSPHSPPILNNLGNHYEAEGKSRLAAKVFLEVVALQPDAINANLQLARISLAAGQAERALECLSHLPASLRAQPAVELLDAQALHQAGRTGEAEELLQQIEEKAGNDPRIPYSVGMTFVEWKFYPEAVESFNRGLALSPTNFDLLSNLGVALIHTSDLNRAAEMFSAALKERPDDVDTLYDLAGVYMRQGRPEDAIPPLVRAHRLAPERPEILLLMGDAANRLGYYGDAAKAFGEYLKIKPHDAAARREEALALARIGSISPQGVQALQRYTREYPKDPLGFYELGMAEILTQLEKAIRDLSIALALDPKLTKARYERALLNYRRGRMPEALADLKVILRQDPENAPALGTLGQVYLRLGKTEQALAVLANATKLAPKNRAVLIIYSQALLRAHRAKEAELVQQEVERLKPEPRMPATGLFSFGALSPEEQQAEIIRRLRGRIQKNPNDLVAKVQLARDLLASGNTAEALQTYDGLFALGPDAKTLSDCGLILLNYGQYALAQKFFKAAVSANPSDISARLDLAVAAYHSESASAGLAELDQTPASERRASYYLLKAQMLDGEGKTEAAAESLNQALRVGPASAGLNFEAALFLIKHGRYQEALGLCQHAVQEFPSDRRLLLVEAISYGMTGQSAEGQKLLEQMESHWPEWNQPYLIEGIILVDHSHFRQAKARLETAIRLGAREPTAYYNLAEADMNLVSPDLAGAAAAIQEALRLNASDPYIQSLAARIAYEQKDYQKALAHAASALRLWPDMLEAHQTLSAVYLALGEREKYVEELKEVLRIKQKVRSAVQTPPSFPTSLLFSVSAPDGGSQAGGDAP